MKENITSFISELHRGNEVSNCASWNCRKEVKRNDVFFSIWAVMSNSTEDDTFLIKSKI